MDYETQTQTIGGQTIFTSSNIFEPLISHKIPVFTPVKSVGYQGIGQTIDPENPFVFPILMAEISTFSVNPEDKSYSNTNGA